MTTKEIIDEITEKLDDLYRITDHYIPLSQQGRFSEYDNAKEGILDYVNEYTLLLENFDDVDEERKEAEEQVKHMKEDLEEIVQDIENMDGALYAEGTVIPEVVEKDLQRVYEKVLKVKEGERIHEPKKKQVKRRK